ncbi:MAG: hypothetical protein LCH67_01580 [Bacteroidetes bacterium]|nr:hypothetical protein [Bacteroidota bacterium]
MKAFAIYILIQFGFAAQVFSQEKRWLEGEVTFISLQNVYLKIENARSLKIGDTLEILKNNSWEKGLIVESVSSVSVLTIPLLKNTFKIGDKVRFLYTEQKPEQKKTEKTIQKKENQAIKPQRLTDEEYFKDNLYARAMVSVNGSMNQSEKAYNRVRTSFSMDYNHINDRKLSLNAYVIHAKRFGIENDTSKLWDNLKIYNLSARYEFNRNTEISFGRKINNQVANIGAIDGLQFEHRLRMLSLGAFAGTRPDFMDYGFNKSLFQYGGFVGLNMQKGFGANEITFAIAEQKYKNMTDRRFAYFQINNSIVKNLNLFYSIEMDLYQNINNEITHNLDLTSTYFSLRYKPYKKLYFSASYDNRRNIIYYETYRTYVEQLLTQETRQGYRMTANYNNMKSFGLSLSGFYRYQDFKAEPTKNYVANLNINRVPGVKAYLNLNYNYLDTYYLKGSIWGGRLSKDFGKGKFYSEVNYRKVNYDYVNSDMKTLQDIIGLTASVYTKNQTSLSLNFESTIEPNIAYNRYFVSLSQRIKNK